MGVTYRAGRDPVTRQIALFATEDSAREKAGAALSALPFNSKPVLPLAIFTPAGPPPVSGQPQAPALPLQQVAENVADLLNHKMPQHRLPCAGQSVSYSRSEHALSLRTRADQGVSVPALVMAVSTKSSVAALGHEVLARMDNDFMKKLCDTIQPQRSWEHEAAPAAKGPAQPGAPV